MSIQFKTFTGQDVEVASIFESSIVTDNISALDGSVTFLSAVDLTENMNVGGNSITNVGNISMVGNLNMNIHDITLVDTIGVDTVNSVTTNASDMFTGDITVSGNLIGAGGSIDVVDDLLLGSNDISAGKALLSTRMYITDTPGFESTVSQIHVQDLTNASMFLEADTDNAFEADVSFIMFSQDGNNTAMNITGGNNIYSIISSTNAGSRGLDLSLGTTVSNGKGNLPTINTVLPKIQIRDTLTTFTQNSDFSDTDISSVDNIQVSTISANTSLDPRITVVGDIEIDSASELLLPGRTEETPTKILGINGSDIVVIQDHIDIDPFGSYYGYAESLSATSSASPLTYVNKVTLVTDNVPAGTYYVSYSCLTTASANNASTDLQFTEDTVYLNTPITTFSNFDSKGEQFYPSNQFYVRTLAGGVYTYALNFKPVGATSRISDAKIIFYRIE